MGSLEGRVALVTGAQQGIGAACVAAISGEGASVVIQYLDDRDAAEAVARQANRITAAGLTD